MKVLVLAQPRSRAMWFISRLSAHRLIKNLDSPYGTDDAFTLEHIQSVNGQLHNEKNFVAKIESTELYYKDTWYGLEPFEIAQYNEIYCLYRNNLVDLFCSLFVVDYLDVWHFWENLPPPDEIGPFVVDPDRDRDLLFRVRRCTQAFEQAVSWLDQQEIPCVKLEYNQVPIYVEQNFTRGHSDMVDGKLDYRKLFVNYDDIEGFLKQL